MKRLALGALIAAVLISYAYFVRNQPHKISQLSTTSLGSTSLLDSHLIKDGTFVGTIEDAYLSNDTQVEVTIADGKMKTINFLEYPHEVQTCVALSDESMPLLISEAISSQSPNVRIVSGATMTSDAFMTSLTAAIHQATLRT